MLTLPLITRGWGLNCFKWSLFRAGKDKYIRSEIHLFDNGHRSHYELQITGLRAQNYRSLDRVISLSLLIAFANYNYTLRLPYSWTIWLEDDDSASLVVSRNFFLFFFFSDDHYRYTTSRESLRLSIKEIVPLLMSMMTLELDLLLHVIYLKDLS